MMTTESYVRTWLMSLRLVFVDAARHLVRAPSLEQPPAQEAAHFRASASKPERTFQSSRRRLRFLLLDQVVPFQSGPVRSEEPPLANGVWGHQQALTTRPPLHVLQRHHEHLPGVNLALQRVPLLPKILGDHHLVLQPQNLKLHPSRYTRDEILVQDVHRRQRRRDDEEQQPFLQRRELIERPRKLKQKHKVSTGKQSENKRKCRLVYKNKTLKHSPRCRRDRVRTRRATCQSSP